jgi:iron complex outermembrane recepter protein
MFAEQSLEQIVYPPQDVRGVQTNSVMGELLPVEALRRMLAGTSLALLHDEETGALSVMRTSPRPAPELAHTPRSTNDQKPQMKRSNPIAIVLALFGLAADPALSAVDANSPTSPSQPTGVVQGVVANEATGARLFGARVALYGASLSRPVSTSTSSDGTFRLTVIPPGEYELQVSYAGLDDARRPLQVRGGSIVEQEVLLSSTIYKLAEFTVAGEREGSALAVTQQREAVNVKNIVASDAYGTLHDSNIGTLLQRLPGVGAFNVGGDIRSITIRGIASDLNSVSVNGTRLPSAHAGNADRTFEFENVSADSFEMVELIKAPTPDMDADAIGGAVNLVSKSAFSYGGRRIRLGFGVSHNQLGDSYHPTGKVNYSDVFGAEKRFGVSFNFGYSEHRAINAGPIQQFQQSPDDPVYQWQLQMRNPTGGARKRYSAGLKLGWKQSDTSSFGINFLYNFFREGKGSVPLVFTVQAPQSIAQIGPDGNYVGSGAVLPGYTADVTEVRATSGTFAQLSLDTGTKTGKTWQIQPHGKQTFGDLQLDYGASMAKGKQTQINSAEKGQGTASLRLNNIGFRIDRSESILLPALTQTSGPDIYDYSNYSWNGTYNQEGRTGEDEIYGAQVNAKRTFDLAVPASLKAGVKYRSQNRTLDWYGERVHNFTGPRSKLQDLKVGAGGTDPMGHYRMPDYRPDITKIGASLLNEPEFWSENLYQTTIRNLRTDGELSEDVLAYYVQGDFQIGKLTFLGGVRVEQTSIEGVAARQDTSVTAATHPDPVERGTAEWGQSVRREGNYRDVFPGVHLVYRSEGGLVSRASYSTSIGRPPFGTLMPRTIENRESQVITINNTGLKPQFSDNFDAGVEYYFEPIGLLSANVFLKEIRQFIFSTRGEIIGAGPGNGFNGDFEGWEIRSQGNGGNARVKGFEINYQQQFTFLPGILRGLGVFANYTRLTAKGDYGTGDEMSGSEVAGFIPVTYNAGLTYQYNRWNSRIQWNHRGNYLFQYNDNPVLRRYFAPSDYIDINVQYRLTRALELYFHINNLLDEPRKDYRLRESRPFAYFWSGTRYNAGVNMSF